MAAYRRISVLLLGAATLMCVQSVATVPCHRNPLQMCDFFLQSARWKVPRVPVTASFRNTLLAPNRLFHRSGDLVVTAVSETCNFYPGQTGCNARFFFMSPVNDWNRTNCLGTHPIARGALAGFKNQCVVMSISNALLAKGGWLNYGDNRKGYPANRRCVVFTTY